MKSKGFYISPESGLSKEDCEELFGAKVLDSDWDKYCGGDEYLLYTDVWKSTAYLNVGHVDWLSNNLRFEFTELTKKDLEEVLM